MQEYITLIANKYKDPQNSEMGFRTEFENFLASLFPKDDGYHIHHDARAVAGNKPDFVVLKDKVPILYIENKTVGTDLDKIENSHQMERYFGYANLVLTDQVEFRFYRNGQAYCDPILVGDIDVKTRTITPRADHFEHLQKTLTDFPKTHKEPIRRGVHLAQIMGGKARRIRDNVADILENQSEGDIHKLFATIKKLLVHDMDNHKFADMYAQTLVYGLFVARFYDETPDTFSRQEARDLVPKSNPFLMHFFDHISGVNFETRLRYIVDELCEVFSHANVEELLTQYFGKNLWGEETEGPDPVIHFYEDFLKEYDSAMRKQMGAYYTPTPVVRFMVRAVDQILKADFGLRDGLADASKHPDGTHKVQVLDPATGTGTFISAVIRRIYEHILETGQKGTWPSYVHHELLPRLHAFELMMGPYTIAHLKLGMAFERTGFKHFNRRLGIYLTNALEDPTDQESMFAGLGVAESIAKESEEASKIKRDLPVMVVIGNPPYSGISQNNQYTDNDVYKVEPGAKQKLQERKHWLNDDYVKFIRLGESLVEKNGQGIVAMITAHGYIDNPTFRGMRWHLRQTFDKIYVLDLHGNSNKKETSPDGSSDENVFDIQTGVSIMLGVKTDKTSTKLAHVYKADLYGKRASKLLTMSEADLESIDWDQLPADTEAWIREGEGRAEYTKGFSVAELFPLNVTGVVTMGDSFAVTDTKEEILDRLYKLKDEQPTEANFKEKWSLGKNYAKFVLDKLSELAIDESKAVPISYRPFDTRWTYFDNKVIWRWRESVMKHFLAGENVGLMVPKQNKNDWGALVTNTISAHKTVSAYDINYSFPLYLYENDTKTPNLDSTIWQAINDIVGDTTPEDVLDYVYAVLHSPSYRLKYQEFLKTDFPWVPYPDSKNMFWDLVPLGQELRKLHLLESPLLAGGISNFMQAGSNIVESGYPKFKKEGDMSVSGTKINNDDYGHVWINSTQCFGNVPEVAWNFYIGGYQPAQKWLKDRRGRELTYANIRHYQDIVTVLTETDRVMGKIDQIYTPG